MYVRHKGKRILWLGSLERSLKHQGESKEPLGQVESESDLSNPKKQELSSKPTKNLEPLPKKRAPRGAKNASKEEDKTKKTRKK